MKKMVNGVNYILEKELAMIGGSYFNNYGVNAFLLEDGNILLCPAKHGRSITKKSKIVSFDYFQERFRDENKCDWDLNIDALKYCGIYDD